MELRFISRRLNLTFIKENAELCYIMKLIKRKRGIAFNKSSVKPDTYKGKRGVASVTNTHKIPDAHKSAMGIGG